MEVYYINKTTGEVIDNQREAVHWLVNGSDVSVIRFVKGEWIELTVWEH